ncbi:hypothetical protein CHS0354_000239 [Potamilus streckersoni]|uniref:LRAT domain-containing protein n=1 Tax=Potamilus streckersoni TaxID=2493646 RepID=A0AAE0RQI4_9BIVA|nr:hypothetical protein CHS0354_000239 [Potamilus streckersoni]
MAVRELTTNRERSYQLEDEEDRNITLQTDVQTVFENILGEQSDGTERSCSYCSTETVVTDASSLRRGQHVSIPGQSLAVSGTSLYRHHAIIKETISYSGNNVELKLIHFNKKDGKIKIYETIESYKLHIHELRVRDYRHPKYSPEEVVRRAEMVLNECGEGKFDSYNPLLCNCEHFVTWCIIGKDESFQVQGLKVCIENVLKFVFGGNSKTVQFLLRIMFNSSDEIASALTSATATPVGILAGSIVAYFIYCTFCTISQWKQYNSDKTICWPCFKENLMKLWLPFAAYFGTSILTYIVQRIVLPLLAPWFGVSLLVLLLILSTALMWIIPFIKFT